MENPYYVLIENISALRHSRYKKFNFTSHCQLHNINFLRCYKFDVYYCHLNNSRLLAVAKCMINAYRWKGNGIYICYAWKEIVSLPIT